MAPMATALLTDGAVASITRGTCARQPFRSLRPCHRQAPGRRQELVIRAAEADRSREQNTVGDMSRDQVSAALKRQLERSKGQAGSDDTAGNGNSNGEVSAMEEAVEIVGREEPATDAEREESVQALEELKGRVPLMSQDDVQSAIDRLIQRGGAQAPASNISGDSSGSSSSDSATSDASSGGSSIQAPAKAQPEAPPQAPHQAPPKQAPSGGGDGKQAPSSGGGGKQAPSGGGFGKKAPSGGGGGKQGASGGGFGKKAPSGGGGGSKQAPSGGGFGKQAPSGGGGSKQAPSGGGGGKQAPSGGGSSNQAPLKAPPKAPPKQAPSGGGGGGGSSNQAPLKAPPQAPPKQAPSGGGGGGGKQGKFDADQTYEDGSLLFTAESLGAVSFEELKP